MPAGVPPVYSGLALAVTFVALLLGFYNKQLQVRSRLWTKEELAIYNGTDDRLPILLAILGSVFDVTRGRSHYGPGGAYSHFAGRDASRAFVSGNFTGDGLTDSLYGLSNIEMKSVVDWRDFYSRSYRINHLRKFFFKGSWLTDCTSLIFLSQFIVPSLMFVGKLVGRYYDKRGNPTKSLKGVEARAARGAQLLEEEKNEEAKLPSCSSKWSQQEGGEVWCDVGYPRLVQRPAEIALTGKMSRRCACFKEEELGLPGLEVYKGCDHLSKVCSV